MSNLLDEYELAGLREDFDNLLGIRDEGGLDVENTEHSTTFVTIVRTLDKGTFNDVTGEYDNQVTGVIYAGPAHISPITYRRDRQEFGGGESIRIRQYRGVVPWDAGDIHIDDVLTVDLSNDPDLVGRSMLVSDVLYESEVAARRISLTDTSDDNATC